MAILNTFLAFSEDIKFQIFPGEHVPGPPSFTVLICDVLLIIAAIFDRLPDVGVEMADADAHTKKNANLYRFCDFATSKKTARTKNNFKDDFERYFGINVEDDDDFIHPPNIYINYQKSIFTGNLIVYCKLIQFLYKHIT